MEQDEEVHDVFAKIDYDLSGAIDVGELHSVFLDHAISMTKNEIREFFNLCQTHSKGYLNKRHLNFEEFKDLYNNPRADELFRYFIKRSRKINAELQKKGSKQIYLPFNLSRFLE
jgi:Ca2+-binding EF-hand superfamily protein